MRCFRARVSAWCESSNASVTGSFAPRKSPAAASPPSIPVIGTNRAPSPSGCWRHLKDAETVVIVSGSCGAMVKNFYPQLFANTPQAELAKQVSARVWEFSDFLVTKLGVTDLGARFPARVTFHDGCHGLRELGIKKQPRALLANVRDLQLVEMAEAETCCGFGGTFAVEVPGDLDRDGRGQMRLRHRDRRGLHRVQ